MSTKMILGVSLVCLMAVASMPGTARAQQCGPGPHWIDDCYAWSQEIPLVWVRAEIDLTNDCIADAFGEGRGPVMFTRSDPMDTSVFFPGVGSLDGHMDVMDTEIDSAIFFREYGGSELFGRLGNGYGADLQRTLGAMVELSDDPTLAYNFNDLFFDIQNIPGWILPPLYNQSAMRVEAIINGNPPLSTEFVFEGCLPLYTSPIPGEGDSVCNMVSVIFRLPNAVSVIAWPTGSTTLQRGDTLFFNSEVHNLLENPVEGDLWISVLRPDAIEVEVPESFMNHTNPLHGQVDSEISVPYEIEVPDFAPYGSYQLIARIGTYPDNYIHESMFDFEVVG